MQNSTLNEMTELVVNWAKEQGKIYPSGVEKQGDENKYPAEIQGFINVVKNEIARMDDSFLRKFEHALLHIPDERGFTKGQIIMLNSIRSSVFIELAKRNNKTENEPGD